MAAAIVGLLLLAACGDGDKSAPSGTPGASVVPNAADETPASHTGIPDVDTIIEAVLARDTAELASLVRMRPIACVGPTPSGLGALFCEDGETEGSIIDVLPVAQCESHYTRRDELERVLLFEASIELYAVYRTDDLYAAVFTQQPDAGGLRFGVTVGIDRGLINYIDYGCGQTAAQLVENVADEDFLIAPPLETPVPTP